MLIFLMDEFFSNKLGLIGEKDAFSSIAVLAWFYDPNWTWFINRISLEFL